MAHIIKNVESLGLSEAELQTLTQRAELHRRYSNIAFKVVEVTPGSVVLLVRQGRSHAENYFDTKRLIEILRETFGDMVGGRKIEPRPYVFQPSPPDAVTPEWLRAQRQKKMLKSKISPTNSA